MTDILKNLHVCGNILSSSNYSFFALQCTQCDATLGQWSSFLRHLEQQHGTFKEETPEEEFMDNIEDEIEIKPEDLVSEAIAAEDLKLPCIEEGGEEEEQEAAAVFIETKTAAVGATEADNHELMIEVMEAYAEQGKTLANEGSVDNLKLDQNSSDFSDNEDANSNKFAYDDCSMESSAAEEQESNLRKFRFNISDSDYLIMSLDFLKVFQTHRLLWDPKHVYYRNPRMRSIAQTKMKKYFLEKKIDLSEKILQSTISTLLRKYKLAKQEKEEKGELSPDTERLLRKCSFLDVALKAELESSDDDYRAPTPEPQYEEEGHPAMFTSTRVSNLIKFNETEPLFADFIEQYKLHPILWDTTLYNYNHRGERKRILTEWSERIKTEFNTEITYDELSFSIIEFRRLYYKYLQRQSSSDSPLDSLGKFVLEKGSFLPPKTTKQPIKCAHCSKIFLMPHTLKRHIYVDHGIGEKPFKCNFCEQSFEDHLVHRRHELRYHYKDYRFICEYCNKAFFTRDELERHVMKHTGEKKFVCELCGRGFAKKTNLRLHNTRVHLRQRNFACNMCPKAFYTKRLLQDHINAHLNIRDKICPTCGKGFTSHHSLIRHKQIHSEVKKYACKMCDARFHQFVGLNSHMKNTHKYVRGKNETASDDERHLD